MNKHDFCNIDPSHLPIENLIDIECRKCRYLCPEVEENHLDEDGEYLCEECEEER